MKQFNLQEYLKNPNLKVVTRDGRSVKIVCTNRLDENYPVLALVNYEDYEMCHSYTTFGKLHTNQITDFGLDLFFVPEKKEGWTNIYRIAPGDIQLDNIYNSKEEAEVMAKSYDDYVDTIKIEWEE